MPNVNHESTGSASQPQPSPACWTRMTARPGQISVGDRVVVTTGYLELAGHYGHVIYATYDPEWPVYVKLEGRDGKPVHPDVRENDIWPFFPHELEHAD
jgi:hypothetical protein